MDKNQKRQVQKNKILLIKDRELKDLLIFNKIIALENFKAASSVLIYVSTSVEVDTKNLIQYCFENNKRVFVPFLKEIEIGEIKTFTDLKKVGKYFEPQEKSSSYNIGITIIPGLAFTKEGNRLGQGSGWYDKFLSGHKEIYKIGICYSEQIVDDIPVAEHDVKMDLIITN